jgi:hypothetical protein
MSKEHLSIEEIEDLGYYDFMGYMEVPFFNVGGAASIDRLTEVLDNLCIVLEVNRS